MTDQNEKIPTLGRRTILMGAVASTALAGTAYSAEPKRSDVSEPAPEAEPGFDAGGSGRGRHRRRARHRLEDGGERRRHRRSRHLRIGLQRLERSAGDRERLDQTADGVRKLRRKCKVVHADIRDIASLRAVAANTDEEFGKIGILVANAAIQRWKPPLEMEDATVAMSSTTTSTARTTPSGRWRRVGPAAAFPASDGAAMVSGAEYEVDAGHSAHNI